MGQDEELSHAFGGMNINKENNGAFGQQQKHKMMLGGGNGMVGAPGGLDAEIVLEKEQTIIQLKETIEILELKVKKLEQLVKLKDAKILNLSNKLQTAGITQ